MPSPPKCKICGKAEWRYTCGGLDASVIDKKVTTPRKASAVADRPADKVAAPHQRRHTGKQAVASVSVAVHHQDEKADAGAVGMGKAAGERPRAPVIDIDALQGLVQRGIVAQKDVDVVLEAFAAQQRKKNREAVRRHRLKKGTT